MRVFKGYREEQSLCHTPVVKVKSLYTSCRRTGEWRCNSSHFDLDTRWGEWSALRPVSLPPAKALPIPTEQETVLSREPVWTLRWIEKFIVASGNWIMICRVFRPYPSHRLRYPSFSHISGRDDIVFLLRHLISCFDLKTFLNSICRFFDIFNVCHDGSNLREMIICKIHVNSGFIWRIRIRTSLISNLIETVWLIYGIYLACWQMNPSHYFLLNYASHCVGL